MVARAPGWYQDPDDPAQLRHWSGRGWSGRRRSWPAWAISASEVAADRAWGGLPGGPEGAPVLDGPVRPAPMPAAAARGSLAERREGTRTHRLVRPSGAAGGHAGHLPGHGTRFETPPGWMPSRRPLMIFCALVGVAVLMMAATVVGTTGRSGIASSAVGRDSEFVVRASSVCDAGLAPLRAAAAPSMTAPGQTASQAAGAERAASAVGTVEQALRALPVTAAAADAVGSWLDDLHRYATDEVQLAVAVAAPGPPAPAAPVAASGGRASAPTAAESAAMLVTGDINRADAFAGSNGLAACRLSPAAGSSQYVPIP